MSLFTATSREQRFAIRVGLLMALALALAGIIVFLIGRETQLFERQVVYRTYFENVEGLSEESPVWLSGLEVGRVEAVSFPSVPGERRLEVRLRMSAEHAARVREDSMARLASRGVLGDKAVDISIGSLDEPPIPPGGRIPSLEGGDLTSLLRGASRVMEDTVAVSRTLREAVKLYADPRLAEDVTASMRSLRVLLGEVQDGDGVLHALIYDEEAGRQVRVLLAHASRAALRVDQAL
ncbi:MAG TPA: MCE family protein, partial [Myxococcaceae bacterium]|nr:MCE family protein [Myxococcaceae bacterium]